MPLSQKEFGEFRSLYESVYATEEIIEEELIHEICDELVEELVAEGYSEDDAIIIVEDAANDYIDEAKVTFGSDTAPMKKSGAPVGAKRRFAMRKAGAAVKRAVSKAKSKASGAAADVSMTASAAKKVASSAASAVKSAPQKAAQAAARGTEKVEKKVKSGIKGMIGRAAKKVASKASEVAKRMSEEIEVLKATGLFSEKEIESIMEAEMSEGYDEPKMHSAVKRVMTTQPAAKGRAASRLHSKYSMRSKGNVAGETDGPGPNAPKRSGRKGRGAETDRGSGNAAKRRMEG